MFAYDTPKKKKSSHVTQWSSEPNCKRKTYDSFLGLENPNSIDNSGETENLQRQTASTPSASPASGGSPLPFDMREKYESRAGFSLADVRVYYNSDEPAKLGALAYARGNVVHIGPGQEKHLPHEIGHVVQQKAGLVRPTLQIQGINVNDNVKLEKDADIANSSLQQNIKNYSNNKKHSVDMQTDVAQLVLWRWMGDNTWQKIAGTGNTRLKNPSTPQFPKKHHAGSIFDDTSKRWIVESIDQQLQYYIQRTRDGSGKPDPLGAISECLPVVTEDDKRNSEQEEITIESDNSDVAGTYGVADETGYRGFTIAGPCTVEFSSLFLDVIHEGQTAQIIGSTAILGESDQLKLTKKSNPDLTLPVSCIESAQWVMRSMLYSTSTRYPPYKEKDDAEIASREEETTLVGERTCAVAVANPVLDIDSECFEATELHEKFATCTGFGNLPDFNSFAVGDGLFIYIPEQVKAIVQDKKKTDPKNPQYDPDTIPATSFHAVAIVAKISGNTQGVIVIERNAGYTAINEGHRGDAQWLMNFYATPCDFKSALDSDKQPSRLLQIKSRRRSHREQYVTLCAVRDKALADLVDGPKLASGNENVRTCIQQQSLLSRVVECAIIIIASSDVVKIS
ncbi:MAG: DUF4157 domain-containing protein, partial [Candidatus Bathyarchaeota archaeon]|nr:DUF4157 domain-containing protein [Candidatus Termiticorpusculum sp.]